MILTVAEAKNRFSELMRLVERGETVEVCRYGGEPVMRWVAVKRKRLEPVPKSMRVPVSDSVDDPAFPPLEP